jgi:chemotaxis protein MotB
MRRKKHEEHVNTEAWVIPYADLLTLLLALFVVLYAMSSVNTTKYRALAQQISDAFNGSRQVIRPMPSTNAPTGVSVPTSVPSRIPNAPLAHIPPPIPTRAMVAPVKEPTSPSAGKTGGGQQDLERIRNQVEHALQPLIDKNMVVVRRTANWLEIEIRTDILFPSGVAALSPSANQILTDIGQILAPFANPLRVEGYTDDVPINTALYPSNWELSAARAASVARLFADRGVDPDRLGIVGWGQYHPSADNASQDGRNRNRRVLVVVLSNSDAPTRFYSDTDQINHTADTDPDVPDGRSSLPIATSPPVTAPIPAPGALPASALAREPVTATGAVMPVTTGAGAPTMAAGPHPVMPDTKD